MSESFNLIHEPWIPVITMSGAETQVSIEDALGRAQDYRALAGELSTVNFAVVRVLLALLYRAWDSPRWRAREVAVDHWEEKWVQPSLLDGEVRQYLDRWGHRFDLKDDVHPFFQVADLRTSRNEWKSLETLLPDVGDGTLFTMRTDMRSITAAEAAQMLIHCMAYDYSGIKSGAVGDSRVKGGKGYPMGIGWAGWLGGTLLEGHNLRETLLLNYVPYRQQAGTDDLPIWEMEPLTAGSRDEARFRGGNPERTTSTGQVELLTWPQRRLRLRWDGDRVDGVLITNGDPVGYAVQSDVESMSPWRFSDPQTKKAKMPIYMPQSLDPDRAIWRSLAGILPVSNTELVKSKFGENLVARKPSKSVEWVSTLIESEVIPYDFAVRLRMVTMIYGSNNSSFSDLAEDAITIKSPLLLLKEKKRRSAALLAVSEAETVARSLGNFYRNVTFAVSGEEQVDTSPVRGRLFSAVDGYFRRWLFELADVGDPLDALAGWRSQLEDIAINISNDVLSAQGSSVWTGRWSDARQQRITGANAQLWLRRDLKRLFKPAADEEGTQILEEAVNQ